MGYGVDVGTGKRAEGLPTMARSKPNLETLAQHLQACSDVELRDVLERVFRNRQPYPAEAAYHRSWFFLGIGSSELVNEPNDVEEWSPVRTDAAAYRDQETYGNAAGPDGFCQVGICESCQVSLRADLKQALCPFCGAKVSLS
jgi:hypothetical protein